MYQCTDCEYMNPVKDIIRNHVESHHMSTSFACPLGGHPCPTRNALKSSDIESIKNDILGLCDLITYKVLMTVLMVKHEYMWQRSNCDYTTSV